MPSASPIFRSGFGIAWLSHSIGFRSEIALTKTVIAFYSDCPSKKHLNSKRSMIKRRWTKTTWSLLGVMACRSRTAKSVGSNSTRSMMTRGEKRREWPNQSAGKLLPSLPNLATSGGPVRMGDCKRSRAYAYSPLYWILCCRSLAWRRTVFQKPLQPSNLGKHESGSTKAQLRSAEVGQVLAAASR
jgi:hypothetical protein